MSKLLGMQKRNSCIDNVLRDYPKSVEAANIKYSQYAQFTEGMSLSLAKAETKKITKRILKSFFEVRVKVCFSFSNMQILK